MPATRAARRMPLYQQTANRLRELIESGEIRDILPSQDALCDVLQVSRPTVREAIRLLERAGLVSARQGVGTVVNSSGPNFRVGLEELMSTTELIERNGFEPGTSHFDVRTVKATRSIYPVFADQIVVVIERVRTANGKPLVYSIDVVPEQALGSDGAQTIGPNDSLMVLYRQHGMDTAYAYTTLSAQNADRLLARHLEIPQGTALLLTEEVGYDSGHQPVYSSHDFYRCDFAQFQIVRRSRWTAG